MRARITNEPCRTSFVTTALSGGRAPTPFDVDRVGRLELEWWIVHRERDRHPAGDLDHALAELQSAIYSRPDAAFAEHARRRAEAMLIRDAGGDWGRIAELLDNSWVSLHTAVR